MYTFRFAKRSRMNGPPKLFASRALIGWNLKTCQTEISRSRCRISQSERALCFSYVIIFLISLFENVMCRDADLSVTTNAPIAPLRSRKMPIFVRTFVSFGVKTSNTVDENGTWLSTSCCKKAETAVFICWRLSGNFSAWCLESWRLRVTQAYMTL